MYVHTFSIFCCVLLQFVMTNEEYMLIQFFGVCGLVCLWLVMAQWLMHGISNRNYKFITVIPVIIIKLLSNTLYLTVTEVLMG